jgi:ribosomal protein L37AE/L43A
MVSKMNTVDTRPSYDELLAENARLKQENARVRLTAQFAVDQANAERDESLQKLVDTENRNVWLEEQNKTITASKDYLNNEREWVRGILYNRTFDPMKKIALISSYDFAKSGEWVHLFVGTMAKRVGVYRDTYSKALHQIADQGFIEMDEGKPEETGEIGKKGKPKYKQEVNLRFTEELLKFPDEITFEKEDSRKGNGKGGGKNAKPKQCPECKSVQVDDLGMCKCRKCNHTWEDSPPKDANRGAKITPWEFSTTMEEDCAELAKEFEQDVPSPPEPEPVKRDSLEEPEWIRNEYKPEPEPEIRRAPKSDNHLPEWLRPGTYAWKKQVERNGFEEMMERCRVALEDRDEP